MASKDKNFIEQKEKLARDAAKVAEAWRGLDGMEFDSGEVTYTNRHSVPPPEPKDKSRYNPNNLVDIETFICHPYYLNLSPYPWQILALKLFYAGIEGNSNLEFNDAKKDEEIGCSKCVWNYIVENEKECAKNIDNDERYVSILNPLNSRCLKCSRCPTDVREKRLTYEANIASDKDIEINLNSVLAAETEDLFQSDFDLIDSIVHEEVKMQVKKKIGKKFQELVLVMGRRSGKSFMTVAIALYELYRLLSFSNPQKSLKLPDHMDIHILNVATNEDVARDSIFTPMKNAANNSPFFASYIGKDNVLEMRFLTEHDVEENKRRAAKGMVLLTGTIVLKCGSSAATGMVGKTCWCIILDELSAMSEDNPDSGKDKELYDELKPSLATFGRDGKIISLSNPRGPVGQLFVLYKQRMEDNSALILQLPTEAMNANIDKIWLADEYRKDPVESAMQYGAEFGTSSQDPYLSPEDVNYVFDHSSTVLRQEDKEVGYEYYCHVDPANTSDYYALVVAHAVPTGDRDGQGNQIKFYYIDHIQYWAPIQMRQPIQSKEIKDYIISLHTRFRFKQISFDQWHSASMIQELQALGIPAVLKQFTKEYKGEIYINLLEAFRDRRIRFYKVSNGKALNKSGELFDINEIPEARSQFTFLQKKWKNGKQVIGALSGYKDDICDATAAVLYECNANSAMLNVLPKPRLAYTGTRFR